MIGEPPRVMQKTNENDESAYTMCAAVMHRGASPDPGTQAIRVT